MSQPSRLDRIESQIADIARMVKEIRESLIRHDPAEAAAERHEIRERVEAIERAQAYASGKGAKALLVGALALVSTVIAGVVKLIESWLSK